MVPSSHSNGISTNCSMLYFLSFFSIDLVSISIVSCQRSLSDHLSCQSLTNSWISLCVRLPFLFLAICLSSISLMSISFNLASFPLLLYINCPKGCPDCWKVLSNSWSSLRVVAHLGAPCLLEVLVVRCACEDSYTESLCCDSAFAHKKKIYIFKFPKRFSEISWRDISQFHS